MNTHYYNKLNDEDRLNLCDITWFLKGLRVANNNTPFNESHEESLLKAILAIYEKVRNEIPKEVK